MSSDAPFAAEEPGALSDSANMHKDPSRTSHTEGESKSSFGKGEEVEETLESHEVIEMQAFIERKEWIEEKILFLESLPSIDVFAGAEELSKPLEQISGLPTRTQLNDWLVEHDRIEKESEIFDSGDLKKLKKFTKAATQRNLSPEDTDLIELTLTTLFALDRLFHLLRSRSEHLDLLCVRLTWEEHRADAYSKQQEILADLQAFLSTRARWSTEIYTGDDMTTVSSLGLSGSQIFKSESTDGFSRSARFKLAEALSRDAAQFSSRVTSLRHGHVAASGKALDKLIDDSRKPVPDVMLDEQDRVEEKCAKDLETVGKFIMAVVMQWKKSDEIFVETKKDHDALRSLIDDMEHAMTQHPSRRNETTFSTRIDMLSKRLSFRTNPASSPVHFPLPMHPLFPDQQVSNALIVKVLCSEIDAARDLAVKANGLIDSYRVGCDSVESVEILHKEMSNFHLKLTSLSDRFLTGFSVDDGDGNPPNLTDPACLQPLRYSSYLAMMPSLIDETVLVEQSATQSIKRARITVLRLDRPGINVAFKQSFSNEIDGLEKVLQRASKIRIDMSNNVSKLREVRRTWSNMDAVVKSLDVLSSDLKDVLLRHRWKQQTGGENAPLTPESPRMGLPAEVHTPESIKEQLGAIQNLVIEGIVNPLDCIQGTLPRPLYEFLASRYSTIDDYMIDAQRMRDMWVDVRRQASAMASIREEVHTLESRIEDSKILYEEHFQIMLSSSSHNEMSLEEIASLEVSLAATADSVRDDVAAFTSSLISRVPFVSRRNLGTIKTPTAHSDAGSDTSRISFATRLPFDPAAVDRIVRGDTNAYGIRLAGGVKSLLQKKSLYRFHSTARDVDELLSGVREHMHTVDDRLNQIAQSFLVVTDAERSATEKADILAVLSSIKDDIESVAKLDGPRMSQSISSIREMVSCMRATPNVHEDITSLSILTARASAQDEVDLQSHRLFARVDALRNDVISAEQTEISRLTKKAQREKQDRVEAEAAERAEVLQKERIELARRLREEEEAARLAEERLREEQENARLREEAHEAARVAEEARREKESVTRRQVETDPTTRRPSSSSQDGAPCLMSPVLPSDSPGASGVEEDVFNSNSTPRSSLDTENNGLMARVRSLRQRLRSIDLNAAAYPSGSSLRVRSTTGLPTPEQSRDKVDRFASLESEAILLPLRTNNGLVDGELQSLREDFEAAHGFVRRIEQLARLSASIGLCDTAFSDFLDHIDSYPSQLRRDDNAVPISDTRQTPEEQLSGRISYTTGIVGDMSEHFSPVSDDARAVAEHGRLKQTWEELMEMALEKIHGRPSRPGSVSAHSSGRNSSASANSSHAADVKRSKYSKLSVGGRGGFLVPSTQRRTVSSSAKPNQELPSSRSSLTISRTHAHRSVSGPMSPPSTKSLFNSTFASRQRTTSVSSTTSSIVSGGSGKTQVPAPSTNRRMSSTLLESPRIGSPTMSAASRGVWSRAPRQSFSSNTRAGTPDKNVQRKKQKYIANPKNKLDVAVGDVVNNLPVDINVEIVADTWKDKSGKYWIGGSEPKLCFCRILRSQTVMVRVGGGWSELSKFIKDHFAELFRLIPESPPRPGTREERWISASSLQELPGDGSTMRLSPRSPEAPGPFVPSFALNTPDGAIARSIQSNASFGTPLTPLQFMRRADADPSDFSLSSLALSTALSTSALSTPSRGSATRPRAVAPNTPAKQTVWKP